MSISEATRKRIVYRIGGTRTVVQASAITNTEELAYAISFLAHHRLYKMSKGDEGVTLENAEEVSLAFEVADAAFGEDVLEALDGTEAAPISMLGEGVVENPFNYV